MQHTLLRQSIRRALGAGPGINRIALFALPTAALVTLGVLVYLVYALIRPERF